MIRFANLCRSLERSDSDEIAAKLLTNYLSESTPADSAWTIHLLAGASKLRFMSVQKLKRACLALTDVPEWLYAECMAETGDACETIALLLPEYESDQEPTGSLSEWMEIYLPTLSSEAPESLQLGLERYWRQCDPSARLTLNKLITGSRPVKVSQAAIVAAVCQVSGVPSKIIHSRLAAGFDPNPESYRQLIAPPTEIELQAVDQAEILPSERISFNGVLMYAERGNTGELVLFTFGVWHEEVLVSTAKIPWDASREVRLAIEAFVKENTLERRGPIRVVPPHVVVRIEFEAVTVAPKRKAGIELVNPAIVEWLAETHPGEATTLQWLKGLIAG